MNNPEVNKGIVDHLPDQVKEVFDNAGWLKYQKNLVIQKLISVGIDLKEIDPKWLETLLRLLDDKVMGNILSTKWESLIAYNVASIINIIGDGDLTQSDFPHIEKLFMQLLATFSGYLPGYVTETLEEMLQGILDIIKKHLPEDNEPKAA